MSIKVEVDWNKDNNFSGPNDNVTARVRRSASPVTVEYGRDQSTALAPTVAGRGGFTLDNVDRRFSPRNASSPLYGYLKPSRPVRITRTLTTGTTLFPAGTLFPSASLFPTGAEDVFVIFQGHTDDNPINPDVDSKSAAVSLVDSLADFRGVNVSTPLYSGIRTGQAIGYILDAVGWSGTLRDLDFGATVIPWFWVDNKDALTAMEEVLRSEGAPALLTVGVDGSIVFKDRNHRLLDTPSLTSQATWRNKGTEPVMNRPFVYDEAWRNIINTGTVDVDVRAAQAEDAVWTSESIIGFSANETRTFIASTSDPFINAVVPAAGTDFTVMYGGITSVSLSTTSGTSAAITLTANGSAGGTVLDRLQLRAQPVSVAYTIRATSSDSASIDDYGPRSFPGDLPWCGFHDAQAVLDKAVEFRAQPLPILQVRFMIGTNTTRCLAILARDISDMVTVVEDETVLNGTFYCESFAHEFTGEHDHTVIVGLEAVPISAVTSSNVFILGSSVSGHRLGSGVLAA